MQHNVWRYVQLPQHRGGMRFCPHAGWRNTFRFTKSSRNAKTMTPGGRPRQQPGRSAPQLKIYHVDHDLVAVQKAIAYTDLLGAVYFINYFSFCGGGGSISLFLLLNTKENSLSICTLIDNSPRKSANLNKGYNSFSEYKSP